MRICAEVLSPPPPPPLGEDGPFSEMLQETTNKRGIALRVWIWVPEGEEAPVGGMIPHEGAFLPWADMAGGPIQI